ncbi:MAG: metallophosphoesterase, partial [Parasporobacterium sp.]|nr:metallophosphoesterase [Parasporobacterium sp.]
MKIRHYHLRISIFCMLLISVLLASCCAFAESPSEEDGLQQDVVVLFTSDVHCGVDQGFGYAGLQAIKDNTVRAGNHVLLVDNGDSIQGEPLGTLTTGEADIRLMNTIGYDIAVPGNHEFDYGMTRFLELADMAEFP